MLGITYQLTLFCGNRAEKVKNMNNFKDGMNFFDTILNTQNNLIDPLQVLKDIYVKKRSFSCEDVIYVYFCRVKML